MKLKEYIENLTKFAKENPEALELDVMTSSSEEKSIEDICKKPSLGHEENGFFFDKTDIAELIEEDKENGEKHEYKINAVCIN